MRGHVALASSHEDGRVHCLLPKHTFEPSQAFRSDRAEPVP